MTSEQELSLSEDVNTAEAKPVVEFKDPRVCRIFISSPFNGLEKEREELTKRHWPRIQTLCASRGIQLRIVDMRWGITHHASGLAQTALICLKELDRSDIVVGFFAQRYGWHGVDDENLQKNFDVAQAEYPWIQRYRDRSITELEFLHGHLNTPGDKPACIMFRDKSYDEEKRYEAQQNNDAKAVSKYTAESTHSSELLNDLKRRVKESEDKTLGVLMDYPTPQEAAQFAFDRIWSYLNEQVFVAPQGPPPTEREVALAPHDAFIAARTEIYMGGENYFKVLDDFIDVNEETVMLITGDGGTGKSALLCNWIKQRTADSSHDNIIVYHFIGCASGTTKLSADIIQRLASELDHHISEKQFRPLTAAPQNSAEDEYWKTDRKKDESEKDQSSSEQKVDDGKTEQNSDKTEKQPEQSKDDKVQDTSDQKPTDSNVPDDSSKTDNADENKESEKKVESDTPAVGTTEEASNKREDQANKKDGISDMKDKSDEAVKDDKEIKEGQGKSDATKKEGSDDVAKKKEKKKKVEVKKVEVKDFHKALKDCGKGDRAGTKFVFIVDGLNRIDKLGRMVKPMYWIPEEMPGNVKFILATDVDDKENMDALREKMKIQELEMQLLTDEEKRAFCLKLLEVNSKQLTPEEQLPLVLNCPRTALPLYLKITIEELCQFGKYRELTTKIKDLISTESVVGLFDKFLERLEEDYDPTRMQIKQVMSSLRLSRKGVTETELMEMWNIPSNAWSALYFAIDQYMVNREGKLCLGYDELITAVDNRYLTDEEEKVKLRTGIVDYFYSIFEKNCHDISGVPKRVAEELPYLMRQNLPAQRDRMLRMMTSLPMVAAMATVSRLDIIEHWFAMEIKIEDLAKEYIKSLDLFLCDRYLQQIGNYEDPKPVTFKIFDALDDVRCAYSDAKLFTGESDITQRQLELLDNVGDIETEEKKLRMKVELTSNLAISICENEQYEEGIKLHEKAYEMSKMLQDGERRDKNQANALHGIAVIEMKDKLNTERLKQSKKHFEESLVIYEKLNDKLSASRCWTNLGLLQFYDKEFHTAIETFERVLKMQADIYYDRDSIDVSYTYLNIGLCYRHLKDYDKTEYYYQKSLDIKVKAMGWMNNDVGLTLMNLGTLHMHKKEYPKALEYAKKCRDIYEELMPKGHSHLLMIKENLVVAYLRCGMKDEMEKLFWEVYEERKETDTMNKSLPIMLKTMIVETFNREEYDKCEEMVLQFLPLRFKKLAKHYCILVIIDQAKPEAERPKRPYEQTLEYAAEQWPTDDLIFDTAVEYLLLPQKKFDDIKEAAEKLLRARQDGGNYEGGKTYGYTAGADYLMEKKYYAEALDLLKSCPEDPSYQKEIWQKIVDVLKKMDRKDELEEYQAKVAGEGHKEDETAKSEDTQDKGETAKKSEDTQVKDETEKKSEDTQVKDETEKKSEDTQVKDETEKKSEDTQDKGETEKKSEDTQEKDEAEKKSEDTQVKDETEKKSEDTQEVPETKDDNTVKIDDKAYLTNLMMGSQAVHPPENTSFQKPES